MSDADELYPDIEAWCRLCLKELKDAFTILADDEAQLSIPMRLMACLSLEAKSTDGLPKRICDECRYQLEKSFVFRQRSQAADKKLRKHIRLVSMGKKSRVFSKIWDDSDEDELEFEESTAFIEQMENECDKRSQRWRKRYKHDMEQEFASRLEASREQLSVDIRKQVMEEVRSDVRLQLLDEVQEETRKEQIAKLLGELEVFLVEKKTGVWQTLGELPAEAKESSESFPVSPVTEEPTLTPAPASAIKPSPTIEPRQLRKRERIPPSPNQDAEFVLDTDSKVDQISVDDASEGFPDIKMVGAGDIVTSKNGEIYIINAGATAPTSTSSIEFRQDKSITSYNIKDNGDIQFNDAKSDDLGDVVVFDLQADVGDEQQLYEFNENVIILSNENTTNDVPTPVKRSKSDFVVKRAPQSTKPSIGRESDTLKTFQCQLCPIAFATQKLMSRHLSTHIKTLKNGKGGALRCPVCDLQLSCASSLKRHMIIHSGLKPYKCDECDSSFSQREVLKRHMDRHTGTKRHQCPQCETCFAQKTNLQQHINRMHNKDGERQHKCHLCKSSFNHVSGLSRHLVTHAGVTFACKECGRQFNDRSAVQRHLQNVHKMKDECTDSATVSNGNKAESE